MIKVTLLPSSVLLLQTRPRCLRTLHRSKLPRQLESLFPIMSFQTQPVSPEGSVFIGIDFGTTYALPQCSPPAFSTAFSNGAVTC